MIDGRYWFPTATYADDVLNGRRKFRMLVRYSDQALPQQSQDHGS